MNLQDWLTGSLANKLLSTTILIVAVLIIRKYVVHWIKSKETFLPTFKRQWIVRVRNITIFLIFGILVVVWLEQLRTIAASIVVIAAAIVIATKADARWQKADVALLQAAKDVSAPYLDQARPIRAGYCPSLPETDGKRR